MGILVDFEKHSRIAVDNEDEFWDLMMVLEKQGAVWRSGERPTQANYYTSARVVKDGAVININSTTHPMTLAILGNRGDRPTPYAHWKDVKQTAKSKGNFESAVTDFAQSYLEDLGEADVKVSVAVSYEPVKYVVVIPMKEIRGHNMITHTVLARPVGTANRYSMQNIVDIRGLTRQGNLFVFTKEEIERVNKDLFVFARKVKEDGTFDMDAHNE